MACVDSPLQHNLHDAMALRRDSIQRMSKSTASQGINLINFRIYESQSQQPASPKMSPKQPHRSSFVKRCAQLATGRRPSITPTHTETTTQPPTIVQWVQRLPSSPCDYEDFLESALEEAVGQLVCGPNVAAEEFELAYNYDTLEDAAPEGWVRVQAQRVEAQGKEWIAASIQAKGAMGERAEVYAYGRWVLVKTRRQHH